MAILTILVFIITLGVLVFVHELGHFIMAKRARAKVEEFGFGFPPRIFGVKRGETIYSINLIPIGGFVNIVGENGEGKDNQRSFSSKTIWQRFQILIAGVTANVLLAVILFSMVSYIGFPYLYDEESAKGVSGLKIAIMEVMPNSPAEVAGISPGDIILSLKAEGSDKPTEIKSIGDVKSYISGNLGKNIIFEVKRGNRVLDLKAQARLNSPASEGATGISLGAISAPVSAGLFESIRQGIAKTWDVGAFIVITLLSLLKELFTTGKTTEPLSGPVGIAVMVGQATELGLSYVLQFMGLLSVNLAIVNALPFPALDGGRILFLLIEKIKGKPVSAETEGKFHFAGMVILILLMVLITAKDFGTYHIWQKITSFL